MNKASSFLPLCAGLGLGAGGAWAVRIGFASPAPPSRLIPTGGARPRVGRINLPARLVPGEAKAAYAVHGALLGDLAGEDPQAALAGWQALSDPGIRAATIPDIVRAWGRKDPAAALQWEAEQPDASGRSEDNYHYLIYQWSTKEPEAALRWVEDLAVRQPEQHLVAEYFDVVAGAWTMAAKPPRAGTADLYVKIRDPKLRLETLTRHVHEWLTKAPAAAKAWVEANPALTSADRAALLASAK